MSCQNNEFVDGSPIDPITRKVITDKYKFGKICYNVETIRNIILLGNRTDPFTEELIPKKVYDDLNIEFDPNYKIDDFYGEEEGEYNEHGLNIKKGSTGVFYMDYQGLKNVLWGPFMFMIDNRNIGSTFLKGFVFPKHIIFMDLHNTNLTSLVGINFPKTLRGLILSNNKIKSLKNVVFPNNLHTLILSENLITSLKDARFPQKITSLSLHQNKIKTLKDIKFPNSIEDLNLSDNEIKSLIGFKSPKNLKKLDIARNPLQDEIFIEGVEIVI